MTYNKLNNLLGWLIFALGFIVFLLTTSPTASFWDCGEFIATANEFMVPHPPGAPLYMLIGRMFILLGIGAEVSYMMNLLSVVASAFTGLFTFWVITMLAKRIVSPNADNPKQGNTFAIMAAGLVGGATVFFCSSFWFNAVEAEVYALSSMFSALIVWLMFKWEARAHHPGSFRWLILIAFLIGLSFGVHLLSLLTIPALALIYYFRVKDFSWKGVFATLGISAVLVGVVQIFMGIYTFKIAWLFEKFFTGTVDVTTGETSGLGFPMWTGATIFFVLFFGAIIYGIYYTNKAKKVMANIALVAALFVYLGMSTYALIFIRAFAEPPINENDPDDISAAVAYIGREQYGSVPLLYGPMYNAQPVGVEDQGMQHYSFNNEVSVDDFEPQTKQKIKNGGITDAQINSRYVAYQKKTEYNYNEGSERFFPRMHDRSKYRIKRGGGLYHGSYINYVSKQNQGASPSPLDDRPTGAENLWFFLDYQVGHMYLRYFGWNFIGRAGDEQSSRSELFYSSAKYDKVPAGAKPYVKEAIEDDKNQQDRNHYYAIPLLLGLLGLAFQINKDPKNAAVVGILFLAGGFAIILYLNQPPLQPRERDYSYAGSFTTFCIWIGLGVLAIWEVVKDKLNMKSAMAAMLAGVVAFAAVPMNMMAVNWNDHSRAGRYVAPDSARNLLNSCKKDAILFTNGDNDTFPLWYLQEVEGVRTDVRVVNLSLLNTDWYIHGLKKQQNEGKPVPIGLSEAFYMGEKNAVYRRKGQLEYTIPTHKDDLLKRGLITKLQHSTMKDNIKWKVKMRGGKGNRYLMKQDLMIIDMVRNIANNNWKRPMYFAITIPDASFIGLQPFFSQEGMAQRVLPVDFTKQSNQAGAVNVDEMYDNLVNKFVFRNLQPGSDVYLDANIERMLGNFRNNYVRLASQLVQEADNMNSMIKLANMQDMTDTIPSLEKKRDAYYKKAKQVLDKSRELISYDAAEAKSYIHSQNGEIYAKLAQKGFKTKALALEELEMGRKRARIQLVKEWAGADPGSTPNFQRNLDVFALNSAKETYKRILNDKAKAKATLQELYNLTMIPMFKQELDRMGKDKPGKPKAAPLPDQGAKPADEEVLDADPTVQGQTDKEVVPKP